MRNRLLGRSGRLESCLNLWSLTDVVTLLAPLGAGSLGLHCEGASNRRTWLPHLAFFIGRETRQMIIDGLFDARALEYHSEQPSCSESLASYLADLADRPRGGVAAPVVSHR